MVCLPGLLFFSWDDPYLLRRILKGGQWNSWRWSRTIFAFDTGEPRVTSQTRRAYGFLCFFLCVFLMVFSMVFLWFWVKIRDPHIGEFTNKPSGKPTVCYGTSRFFMGKSTISKWANFKFANSSLTRPGTPKNEPAIWGFSRFRVLNLDPVVTRPG